MRCFLKDGEAFGSMSPLLFQNLADQADEALVNESIARHELLEAMSDLGRALKTCESDLRRLEGERFAALEKLRSRKSYHEAKAAGIVTENSSTY